LRRFWYSPSATVIGFLCLCWLAACAPTAEPPPRDEPRNDRARRDEAPRTEAGHDQGHGESRSRPKRERSREERGGATDASNTRSPGQPHDLSVDEAQGGHTLSRHVGRSDFDLQERLQRETNISAASTYTDRATAEAVVGRTLDHNSRIEGWTSRGDRRPNLALDYHGDRSKPIGRCLPRGSRLALPAFDAIVVLRASRDGGFYVLTTYPECPR
jgi:Bacterial CdiA-CT RNAse A domain